MRSGTLAVWAAIVIAPASAVPSLAFSQVAGRDGFHFDSSSIAVGFDSGVTIDSTSPFGDQLIRIVPTTVRYTRTRASSTLSFSYVPEIEVYVSASEFNAWNHNANARYRKQLSRSFAVDVYALFVQTNDISRQIGILELEPRGKFVEGRASAGLTYTINRETSLGFRLNAGLSQRARFSSATTGSGPFEQISSIVRVSLSRRLNSAHSLSVNYGYVRTSQRDSRVLDQQANESDDLDVGYVFTTQYDLTVGANVGIIRRRLTDTYTHSIRVNASKRWRDWTLLARYDRTIGGLIIVDPPDPSSSSQIQDPALINSTIQSGRLRVSGELVRRVRLSQALRFIRAPRAGAPDGFLQSLSGQTTVKVRAGSILAPYVTVGYWLQNTAVVDPNVSRFRITAGLQFYWSKLTGAPPSSF